jgi:hypothetical protein
MLQLCTILHVAALHASARAPRIIHVCVTGRESEDDWPCNRILHILLLQLWKVLPVQNPYKLKVFRSGRI